MTDKEYIEYAKAVHEEAYAMSTPMVDAIAAKVLTRIRKEQKNLMPMKTEWTSNPSYSVDVVDVLSVYAHRGLPWAEIHKDLEAIIDRYTLERFNELEPKSHFIVKYRYIGESELTTEVKTRIYEKLRVHYDTLRFQSLCERFPDLNNIYKSRTD